MSIPSKHPAKNDLGFDSRTEPNRKRSINADGSFNIKRKNNFWSEFHIYQWVITCKWSTYWYTVLSVYAGAYTHAGPEIGVASTKAFTAQVSVLTLMALSVAQIRGAIIMI